MSFARYSTSGTESPPACNTRGLIHIAFSILFATLLTHTTHTAAGQSLALKGTNKCQCGLDVAKLPPNCNLGHLHHLDADDGKTYHYMQFAQGKGTLLGHGTHFKDVEVAASAAGLRVHWTLAPLRGVKRVGRSTDGLNA